jgi:hypothetical protein
MEHVAKGRMVILSIVQTTPWQWVPVMTLPKSFSRRVLACGLERADQMANIAARQTKSIK